MSSVGIYSGVFDPIHDGHLAFARAALEQGIVTEVYFMLESAPRRKTNVTVAHHRQAMLQAALAAQPHMTLLEPSESTLSIKDTLPWLQQRFPDQALCLMMGSDLFKHIETWPDYTLLRQHVSFGVAIRDGEQVDTATLAHGDWAIASPLPVVSSSQIRLGHSEQAPAAVRAYIKAKHLYST